MSAAPSPAPQRPAPIPLCQAFTEAVAIVRNGLDANGIRWNPEAEQDAVSTLLIQAGKVGMLLPWNRPGPIVRSGVIGSAIAPAGDLRSPSPLAPVREFPTAEPPTENERQGNARFDRSAIAAAPLKVLDPPETRRVGEPFPKCQQPRSVKSPNPGPSDGATATGAAATPKNFLVMLQAFRELETELPPEVYSSILTWYGVSQPEDFRPEDVKGAAACYVALKRARDQYRVEQQVTVEHFEATEEGWR